MKEPLTAETLLHAGAGSESFAGEWLTLENEFLKTMMWPRMGGKLISICAKGRSFDGAVRSHELLHAPIHPYSAATRDSSFEDSDAGGWDECLPTVAACLIEGDLLPDHGDLWRLPWRAEKKAEALEAWVDAFSVPLRFSRRVSLEGQSLRLYYSVKNTGAEAASYLWSCHPLFRVDEGDCIVLPKSVKDVRVEGSSFRSLMQVGEKVPWPSIAIDGESDLDLSRVGERDGRTWHKLFAGPLQDGWCALYRRKSGFGVVMRFDPSRIPFAGLWISSGAWPAGGGERSQYTVALEPTTARCDALASAESIGDAIRIAPAGEVEWEVRMDVMGLERPLSYDEFREKLG